MKKRKIVTSSQKNEYTLHVLHHYEINAKNEGIYAHYEINEKNEGIYAEDSQNVHADISDETRNPVGCNLDFCIKKIVILVM